nr:beta-propeller fold lactonase family protein [Jiangella muralis]
MFTVPSGGGEPCHVAVDPTGRLLVATNYAGGSLAILTLDPAGGPAADGLYPLPAGGSGVDAARQDAPHPHQAVFDGDLLYVTDLGADLIRRYPGARGPAGQRGAGTARGPCRAAGHRPDLTRTPDGGHVIVANRGVDTLGVVATGPEPRQVAEVDAGVKWPQHLAWSGSRLYVAGWDSDAVSCFDWAGSSLRPAGIAVRCGEPGWLLAE